MKIQNNTSNIKNNNNTSNIKNNNNTSNIKNNNNYRYKGLKALREGWHNCPEESLNFKYWILNILSYLNREVRV